MSILVISDVHASIAWKKVFTERKTGDIVVFLGDYFDKRGSGPFAENQVNNFLDIVDYAKNNPNTFLLTGNHEYDYMPFCIWSHASKYPDYKKAIMDNIDLLQMVYVHESGSKRLVFSHAGVTNTFMVMYGLRHPEELNDLWRHNPGYFDWKPSDPVTRMRSQRDGDDIWQSPIWVRTYALEHDGLKDWEQVIGHTPVKQPTNIQTEYGDKILMTCSYSQEIIRLDI